MTYLTSHLDGMNLYRLIAKKLTNDVTYFSVACPTNNYITLFIGIGLISFKYGCLMLGLMYMCINCQSNMSISQVC